MSSVAAGGMAPETAGEVPVPASRLHLRNVTKSFGGRKVVNIEDLALGRHGIEGLIGPNGAGKTTLMNLITQKLKLGGGWVLFSSNGDGQIDISGMSIDRVARLGIVKTNQIIRDFDGLTIRDSLLLSLAAPRYERFYRVAGERTLRRETEAEIDRYLDYFHFDDPDGQALSAGEKKLLDIIRCLLVKPRLLLMDEPDLGLIWEVCEFVHFMADGEILVQGTPAEIRQSRIVTEKYLGTSDD
jgi:ABC-type branched-subunit amino acid transport system ATPase component